MDYQLKKHFSRIGLAGLGMLVATIVAQLLAIPIIRNIPFLSKYPTVSTLVLVGFGFYCIGAPVCYLVLSTVPPAPKRTEKHYKFSQIIMLIILCVGSTYFLSMMTTLFIDKLQLLFNTQIDNSLNSLLSSDLLSISAVALFTCILSPLIEEVVFRGWLLDRVKIFGDRTAIIYTALFFGLYHQNLHQFFYATALGMIFAYVTLKTNSIKTACILHIVSNTFGALIIPGLSGAYSGTENLVGTTIAMFLVVGFIVGAIVLLIKNHKQIYLENGFIDCESSLSYTMPYFNIGTIIYISVTVFIILFEVIASIL